MGFGQTVGAGAGLFRERATLAAETDHIPILAGLARAEVEIMPRGCLQSTVLTDYCCGARSQILPGGQRDVAWGLDRRAYLRGAALFKMVLRVPDDIVLLRGGDGAQR